MKKFPVTSQCCDWADDRHFLLVEFCPIGNREWRTLDLRIVQSRL
jgi:hypothetical protein